MDILLIYNKEDGQIEQINNHESIDVYHAKNLKPYMIKMRATDENGIDLGEFEVPFTDPENGPCYERQDFPTTKDIIYVTTKSFDAITSEEIDDFEFEQQNIVLIQGVQKFDNKFVGRQKFKYIRKIDKDGKVVLENIKRKRILEEHYNDLITDFSLENMDIETLDFSRLYTELSNNYKVHIDADTNKKTIVKKG